MNPTPGPTPILIQVVGVEGAPWWGVPAIAGGFLVLGALLGFWFNKIQDDRKAKRELAARYMDQRLEHCSALLESARVVDDLLRSGICPSEAPEYPRASEKVSDARVVIREAGRRAMGSYSAITLIAPEELRTPARVLVVRMMVGRILNTASEAREAHKALSGSIKRFEAAGRKHFGADESPTPPDSKRGASARTKKESPSRSAPSSVS